MFNTWPELRANQPEFSVTSLRFRLGRNRGRANSGTSQAFQFGVLVKFHDLVGAEVHVYVKQPFQEPPLVVAAKFSVGGGQFGANAR